MTQVENEIVQSLRRIIRSIDVHSRALSREYELTWPQLAALQELERQGKCPVGRLASEMFIGAPTLTGIVDRLEQGGLVERLREAGDRRKVLVTLTEDGRRLLSRKPSLLNERVRSQLGELPERQQKRMLDTLQRLVAMMEPPGDTIGDNNGRRGKGK